MDFINNIISFLFDNKRKISSKASIIIFTVITLIILDNLLGFTYYLDVSNKTQYVKELNLMINDSISDLTTKKFADSLRLEVIKRENIVQKAYSFLHSIKSSRGKKENKITRGFWFHFSSSGLFYLLAIVIFPIILNSGKKSSFIKRLGNALIASGIFIILGIFFYWILDLIPQILKGYSFLNIILNFIIQIFVIILFAVAGSRAQFVFHDNE